MTLTYGHDLSAWEAAREEARQILVECARQGEAIAYSELVGEMKTIRLEPDSNALAGMLGQISAAEYDSGRGMLTVLVIHKGGDMMPGRGFFELAEELGEVFDDDDELWITQFKKVIDAWK